MTSSRTDVSAREILAATEEVARTLMGNVVDALAETAQERTFKWTEATDALANLSRIRDAVNSGEEITWAAVDFFLSVMEQAKDGIPVRAFVTSDVYDALEEQGRSLGMTAQGFLTALAMQSAKNHAERKDASVTELRRALIVAASKQRADEFIRINAEAFNGWRVTVALAHRSGSEVLGHNFHLAVLLDDPTETLEDRVRAATRLGNACIVKAGLIDRFDPNIAVGA